jgi:hypothetical protein
MINARKVLVKALLIKLQSASYVHLQIQHK